ncbi:MAG: hypothetical protein IPJ34_33690 [Myxococcales bacterium]|nr:hypothetical protein [Myxococcales bacterium]
MRRLLGVLWLATMACGGKVQETADSGADAPEDFASRLATYCTRMEARAARCGASPSACRANIPCIQETYDPRVVALLDCLEVAPCGEDTLVCLEKVTASIPRTGLVAKLTFACADDATKGGPGCEPAVVAVLPLFSAKALDQAGRCPTVPVGSIGPCLDRLMESMFSACKR